MIESAESHDGAAHGRVDRRFHFGEDDFLRIGDRTLAHVYPTFAPSFTRPGRWRGARVQHRMTNVPGIPSREGNMKLGLILVAVLLAGCGGGGSAAAPSASSHDATPIPSVSPTKSPSATVAATPVSTPRITAEPTPEPVLPTSYAKLSARNWALLVKNPDKYKNKGYQVWACITQFDAATGPDNFRADASYAKQEYWGLDGTNAVFVGMATDLENFVENDVVVMNTVAYGSYSYDTQIGGSTTVPLFLVLKITRKGSCD